MVVPINSLLQVKILIVWPENKKHFEYFFFFLKKQYIATFLCKGPLTPKSKSYIMFTFTAKAAGEKSIRHLFKNVKRGGLRSA
jgi:hypothetical protein